MAANNLSQLPLEASGQPAVTHALASQLPLEVSGQPAVTNALAGQLVIEVSGTFGILVTQSSTFTDPDSFPSGGTVTKAPTGIPVTQSSTFIDPDSFPSGGLVSGSVPVIGASIIPSPSQSYQSGVVKLTAPPPPNVWLFWSGHGLRPSPSPERNEFDDELLQDKRVMERLLRLVRKGNEHQQKVSRGGLGDLSSWMEYCPPQPHVNCHKVNLRKNLFERGKILTPSDGGLSDHTVLEFLVPTGYSCSLLSYYTIYTGTGFTQGSGDIVWRLKVGNSWARNMGYLPYSMGSSAGTVTLGTVIELESHDRVQFLVNVPNTSGLIQVGSSYILCGIQGWLYPSDTQRQFYDRG